MKIAYIIYPGAVISGNSNGIKSQARTWGSGLSKLGHNLVEVNPWGNYLWKEFDLIHVFGTGLWVHSFIKSLFIKNKNIVFSPIIDTIQTPFKYKISTYLGLEKLRLWSPTYTLKKTLPYVKGVFVRSDYEALFLKESMGFSKDKIHKVMLPFDSICEDTNQLVKENFCLHISSIYQDRKNVVRLIKAAKKYNFNLILAGSKGTAEEFLPLKREIGNLENIKVLGFISEEEKIDLYKRAKVFALPSISEGVGIVALDAANYGCDIVITNIGGPKEYYNNMAEIVNPFDIDAIGTSIKKLLQGKSYQPKLKEYVVSNFNKKSISTKLEREYLNINNAN
jgi:glycosyltransferase involved in cell wall biosynthesis